MFHCGARCNEDFFQIFNECHVIFMNASSRTALCINPNLFTFCALQKEGHYNF